MGEIRTVTTPKRKREEIAASIKMYEKKIAQARADLAHVAAAIRIFEASDRPRDLAQYVDHYRLFKRGEPWTICAAALADGPKDTKELALAMMAAKGMEIKDSVLAKAIGHRLIHSLRMQEGRGAQLRAVVTPVGGTINIVNDKGGSVSGYNISPNFRNWGGTRTEKALGWASVHYFDGDVPNNIDFTKPWDKVEPLSAIIPANATALVGPLELPAADAEKAFNKQGVIILWGHLDWSDIFAPNDIHPIQFCLRMNPSGKNDKGEILFGQPTTYKAECNSSK